MAVRRGGGPARMEATFWAVGELTPILGRDGSIMGFIKIVRDRTAQRQAEEEVHQDRRTLEILNRAGSF